MEKPFERIGLVPEEMGKLLHIGAATIREYAETDPTFPAFRVGSKLLSTRRALEDWATARAKRRVGLNTPGSNIAQLVLESRRERKERKEG